VKIRPALRGLASLVLAGLLAGMIGFGWFLLAVQRPNALPAHVDGIVALTGGADRIEAALRLLDSGRADLLLVSGVAQKAALPSFAHRVDLDPAVLAPRVTLGRSATSTFGNAKETAAWASQHAIHSLIVVTANYHMPRALLELGRALPGVTLYPAPVQPVAMTEPGMPRLLVMEYVRLVAAACGLSRLFHGHASI
jgi:uncharacterized SAM-binding protein YcdF (DUF218 family)